MVGKFLFLLNALNDSNETGPACLGYAPAQQRLSSEERAPRSFVIFNFYPHPKLNFILQQRIYH